MQENREQTLSQNNKSVGLCCFIRRFLLVKSRCFYLTQRLYDESAKIGIFEKILRKFLEISRD